MSINFPPIYTYISPGLLSNMRREVRRFLLHTYTRTTRIATTSTTDSWGQQVYSFAAPVTSIPCFYAVKEVPIPTTDGLTTLNIPVLTLGFDDPIMVGDHVSNIQAGDSTVLIVGPMLVESLQPRDPNMGGPVLIEAHLRQVEFIPTS